MSDAAKMMCALDVLMLVYGEVNVVSPESFLRGRLAFCDLMRALVPDQIAALEYTTGCVEAREHGEDAATDWVMNNPPVALGLRMIAEAACNSAISEAHDTGELPLRPVDMEASYMFLEFLDSFRRVLLQAIKEYPTNSRLRKQVMGDLRAALAELEKTGIIEDLRGHLVQESGQRMLM